MAKMGRPVLADIRVNLALDFLMEGEVVEGGSPSRRWIARSVGLSSGTVDNLAKELSLPQCEHRQIAKRCFQCAAPKDQVSTEVEDGTRST